MTNMEIDWSGIHRRLEGVTQALQRGFAPGPDERGRILRARAELLAQMPVAGIEGESIEVVEFQMAREHYGLETRYIREIYPLKEYTPIPCASDFVLGLINVRGQVISVLDMRKFFDMPDKGLSDLNKVVIVHGDGMEFGILADAILGVRDIALGGLQPALPTLTGIREEFLMGVTKERTVVLDGGRILTNRRIVVHEEA